MYIKVEIIAGMREEKVDKIKPDSFLISVREKAERNQANRRVLQIIRQEFGGRGVLAKIVSGHHSPHKIINVEIKD